MPTNAYDNVYQTDDEKTAIILNNNANQSLVWLGSNTLENNNPEKPLILEIANQNHYFYQKDIKEIDNQKLRKALINPTTNEKYQLQEDQKQTIINEFEKNIDPNNLEQKNMLLELKNEYLNQENQSLKKADENKDKEIRKLQENIEALSNVNDGLCKTIGLSLEVHTIVTEKTEELLSKSRQKRKLKEFIKKIDFLTQAMLNKIKEEAKDSQKQNKKSDEKIYTKDEFTNIMKALADEKVNEHMKNWKAEEEKKENKLNSLKREPNFIKNLRKTQLEKINEEIELE